MTTTPADRIAQVLGEHNAVGYGVCRCGWKATTELGRSWRGDHEAHQAAVLAAHPDVALLARVRDVLQRIHDRIVFESKDFGQDRFDVWLYGVIVGWDADEDDQADPEYVAAYPEIQRRFPRFTDDVVATMRAAHDVIADVLANQGDK